MAPYFIWERYGEQLDIKPHLQYLVYYRGCFCPPHIGHFDTASRYLTGDNVRMIIHQIGNQRHNVDKNINRYIWKVYIRELLSTKKIHLVQYNNNTKDILNDHPWLNNVDVVIIIRGDEADNVKIQERKNLESWADSINIFNMRNIDIVFHYTLRNTEEISATTFINKLVKYKNKRIEKQHLYKYLPTNLSLYYKDKIIYHLIKHYLI